MDLSHEERTQNARAAYQPPVARESDRDRIAYHTDRLIAMCLASLRALGVEFTLAEGWDQR